MTVLSPPPYRSPLTEDAEGKTEFHFITKNLWGAWIGKLFQFVNNLPTSALNGGQNADNEHYWRGDGTWAVVTSGRASAALGATSVTVANSLVTATSVITATLATNDATAWVMNVVAGSGTFTVHFGAAATAATAVNWHIIA